ncbi:MAG: TetR/AcrR family transcriptional regulator [Acidobacteriota bacterium]
MPKLIKQEQWIKRKPITELGQRIVSATVEEFASKGLLGARVATIVQNAGTSEPAFYRYFAGIKEAALYIMSEYYWKPLNIRLNHYQQITIDPVQLFEALVQSLIQSTTDDPNSFWLSESKVFRIVVAQMRNPALLPHSILDSEYLSFISKLEDIISLGQQQGDFDPVLPPALVAQFLVSALHGLLLHNGFTVKQVVVREKDVKKVAYRLVGLKNSHHNKLYDL